MASKLQDHVGLLHDSFDDLLKTMFSMISAIQDETNKAENPNQIQFDQLPSLAERIVKKVQSIDILIDETIEETFLGKDIEEIKELLALKITEYEDNVMSLQNNCRAAEQWIGRIQQMLDVIAENTHGFIIVTMTTKKTNLCAYVLIILLYVILRNIFKKK